MSDRRLSFEVFDLDERRWWVLRSPDLAISLNAVIVPAGLAGVSGLVTATDGTRLYPDAVTPHRPGPETGCPVLPDGCARDERSRFDARPILREWATGSHDDQVIRARLVDALNEELTS